MKIAIMYKSVTGNTKKIAEQIKNTLKDEEVVYFGEPNIEIDADIYFVGSWTFKGDVVKEVVDVLKNLKDKKIALFGTAGFGGSQEYFDKLYERAKTNIDSSNHLLGYFYCQGKMPMTVRDKYIDLIKQNPEDKNLQVSLDNFDKALTHPDKEDLDNVSTWAQSIIK